uniref:RRM domain-containing protein n=1 Tax=Hyaloperonospora arabidopsidis (strain Emoy2) TaxID=559515 RepID=M4BBL5_HYAAE
MGRARRLRGQAWVTFDDIASASNALRATNGSVLFDKPAVISFAKEKADVIARREGTFVPREKRPREPKPAQQPATKKQTGEDGCAKVTAAGATATGVKSVLPPPPPSQNVPNKILFLQELPETCNKEMLSVLFKQYQGFMEVRMVPGKKGLAFVEFGDEAQAAIALQGLFGFKLTPTDTLRVSFAKR